MSGLASAMAQSGAALLTVRSGTAEARRRGALVRRRGALGPMWTALPRRSFRSATAWAMAAAASLRGCASACRPRMARAAPVDNLDQVAQELGARVAMATAQTMTAASSATKARERPRWRG